MLYQVEEFETKNEKKLVVLHILMILLVFVVVIGTGIIAFKYIKDKNTSKEIVSRVTEKNQNNTSEQMVIIVKNPNKESFIKNVDNIYNGEEGKRVFLTFDDGPSKSVTPYILDILKKYNIKATFFVLGNRVSSNAELIKREYNEGHYIANHGYTHKYSKIYSNVSEVLNEYNKTEKEIRKALGKEDYSSNLFRFPGGSIGGEYDEIKQKAIKEINKNNIAYLDWNALSNDAAGADTKEKLVSNVKKTVGKKNNVVILMHDAPDKELTYETLEEVIQYLQSKGYKFKNMYDLMN